MQNTGDILTLAYKQVPMQEQMILLQEKEQQIPGSVQYSIKRYHHNLHWNMDDVGMMVYHYGKHDPKENFLELKFCISGNIYCKQKDTECDRCKEGFSGICADKVNTVDVLSFKFSPAHLSQFVKPRHSYDTLTGCIVNFCKPSSVTSILPLCG